MAECDFCFKDANEKLIPVDVYNVCSTCYNDYDEDFIVEELSGKADENAE